MDVKKEYSNGELTVVWKPGLCFHAKECVHGLPDVFKPKDKPWIQPENTSTEALMATINKCPSGALSYFKNADGVPSEEIKEAAVDAEVEVVENGPLLVKGTIEITHTDGNKEVKKRQTAFCRCTKSNNLPFCDGSHNI